MGPGAVLVRPAWVVTAVAEGAGRPTGPGLAGWVLAGRSISDLLDLIVNVAVSVVDGVDGVSVSMVVRGGSRLETSNASSDAVRSIDEAQYERSEGPCVQAIRSGQEMSVTVPTGRWPEFDRRAADQGVRSVCSLPLVAEDATLGALNLYSGSAPSLSSSARSRARDLARHAGVVMANAAALSVAEMTNQQLQEALETRDLIGQAKGILMARERIDADQAFDVLRRASQRTNRKLRDIAAELIERSGRPEAR